MSLHVGGILMRIFGWVIIAVSVLSLSAGCAGRLTDISDGWTYYGTAHITEESPAADESAWKSVSLPQNFKNPNLKVVWIKRELPVSDVCRRGDCSVFLGKIGDIDVTSLNGTEIGRTGRLRPDYFASWNIDRYYWIPPSLLKDERNVLVVKTVAPSGVVIKGRFKVGPTRDIETHAFWKRFLAQYIPLSTGVAALLIAPFILARFLADRKNILFLYFGLTSFIWSLLSLHFFLPDFGISYYLADNLYYALLSVEVALIFFFLQNLYGIRIRFLNSLIIVLALVGVAVSLSSTPEQPISAGWRSMVVGVCALLTQIVWGTLLVGAMRKNRSEALPVMAAYVIFMICLFHDILRITNFLSDDLYWINFGYAAMIISFGVVMGQRISNVARQLRVSMDTVETKNASL
ncbi:MAG TPA: hypothetical protein ENN21_05710, partial [Spirochaetes bacterium]|nr:hypothetical protein [Spirochaetota bacterium]